MIDINVWLALTWDQHPQHTPAVEWFDSIDEANLLFCRFTMLGFLRLLTNRQVMGDTTSSVAGALEIYDKWTRDPRVHLAPESRGTDQRFRRILSRRSAEPATKAISDCYLAAFAEAEDTRLVTFDRALAASARNSVLLQPTLRRTAKR